MLASADTELLNPARVGGRGRRDSRLVMKVHKLTAGDGYTYLTRQVAAHDATNRGYDGLGAYYSEKGEAPGRLDGARAWPPCQIFGTRRASPRLRWSPCSAKDGTRTPTRSSARPPPPARARAGRCRPAGSARPYRIHEQANMFHRRCAGAFRDYNTALGLHADTPVPAEERARMRTELATQMFAETLRPRAGRCPRTVRAPRPDLPAGHDRGRRLRPDLLPGQERVHAVGARPARGRARSSSRPTTTPSPTP